MKQKSINIFFTLIFNLTSLILPLSSLIFFSTCSNPSGNDELVTFSGTVTLEGRTDHSGVKVSLYKPVELDTALVRINQHYPNIGVQISQETEFDHREHTPVYSTTTDASGHWQISGVTPGTYNVVAEKEGFGYRYWFEMEAKAYSGSFTLPQSIELEGELDTNLYIENGFVILNNLIVPQGVKLEITGQSYIVIKENTAVNIQGTIVIKGDERGFVHIRGEMGKRWNIMRIDNNASAHIEKSIVNNSRDGIYNRSTEFELTNTSFKQNETALQNFYVNGLSIRNNLFQNNNRAIENSNLEDFTLTHSIFYKNTQANRILSSKNNKLIRNIYLDNDEAIVFNPLGGFGYESVSGTIQYCLFKTNNDGIIIGSYLENISGNNNNFLSTREYFIHSIFPAPNAVDTLDFTSNFWNLTDPIAIKNKILDYEDLTDKDSGWTVNILPFLTSAVNLNE